MPTPAPPLYLPTTPVSGQGLLLRGMTLLAVEDSRFASDALRLLCQRSGARLRRAESLTVARSHLRCYRPDAVLVDLGLPDGHGTALIRDLVLRKNRPAILGMSGDVSGRGAALAAGADTFFAKPISSLRAFQSLVLRWVTGHPAALPQDDTALAPPDPLALHDDLTHAAALLQGARDDSRTRYVAGFLEGIARVSQDAEMAAAAHHAREAGMSGITRLAAVVTARLAAPAGALIAPPAHQRGSSAHSA